MTLELDEQDRSALLFAAGLALGVLGDFEDVPLKRRILALADRLAGRAPQPEAQRAPTGRNNG